MVTVIGGNYQLDFNDITKKLETSTNIEELKNIRMDVLNYIDSRIKKVHVDEKNRQDLIRRNSIIAKGREVGKVISDLIRRKEINDISLDKAFISVFCDFSTGIIPYEIERYNFAIKYGIKYVYGKCDKCKDIFKEIDKLFSYDDNKLRIEILIKGLLNIESDLLQKDIESRINNLDNEDKELLGFFLNLDIYNNSYPNILNSVIYYNGYLLKFAENLEPGNIIIKDKTKDMISCRLGDILVNAGIGYWIYLIVEKDEYNCSAFEGRRALNNYLAFAIPRPLYEIAKKYTNILPKIEDKDAFFKKKVCGWNIFEKLNKYDHNTIRDLIANNLDKIEDGLSLIEIEYRCSDIGIIDILCRDKDNKHVIIEIKRKYNSDKTVGQAQRYISYIENNPLDELKGVRYIIILPNKDDKLEHSFLSSAHRDVITMIVLDESQIKKLVRYCESCRSANKLTVIYCSKCGHKLDNDKYRYVDVLQGSIVNAWG